MLRDGTAARRRRASRRDGGAPRVGTPASRRLDGRRLAALTNPWPISQSRFERIVLNVPARLAELLRIANEAIEVLALPDLAAIDLMRRVRLPRMHNVRHVASASRVEHYVHV